MAQAKLELLADSRQVRTADRDLDRLNRTGGKSESVVRNLGRAFAVLGGAAAIGLAINNARQFETALLGVAKTTGLAGDELEQFADGISKVALRIPVSTNELLELAQAAGQMGVTGSANLEKFSITVAKLGRASDLAGAEAATALARILNVTGEAVDSIDTLASVIVSLGNNVAATESEIARMTTEVARATSVFGVSSAEAAGLGAAMASIGIRAELGGSSVGRAMQAITSAVQSGGAELDKFAQTLGLNGDRLAEAFEEDKLQAFQMFLGAVGQLGLDAGNALDEVGLGGQEIAKTIIPLSGNLEILTRTLGLANDEVENATALDREFEAVLGSLDSQFQITQNIANEFAKDIGSNLVPSITEVLTSFNEWAAEGDNLDEALDTVIDASALLAAVIGGKLVGAMAASAKSAISKAAASTAAARAELEQAAAATSTASAETAAAAATARAEAISTAARLREAAAAKSQALAKLDQLRAAQAATPGFVLNATAMAELTAAETAATAAARAHGAAKAASAAAINNATVASAANTTAANANAVAMGRVAAASGTAAAAKTALAVASRGAAAAMAFLGGPVGIAITAAAAIAYFTLQTEEAPKPTRDLATEVGNLTTEYKKMTEAQRESAQITIKARLAEINDEISRLEGLRDIRDEVANMTQGERAAFAETLGLDPEALDSAADAVVATQAAIDGLVQRSADLNTKLDEIADSGKDTAEVLEDVGGTSEKSSKAFDSLATSLTEQIIELRDGKDAAEDFAIAQQLGTEATEAERNAVAGLVANLRELREGRKQEVEAERRTRQIEDLEQEIILAQMRNTLANDEYEVRAAILALGDDATPDEQERVADLVRQMQALRAEAELLGPSLQEAFDDTMLSALDQFSQGVSDILVKGESAREVFSNLAATVAGELLSAIIRYYVGQAAAALTSQATVTTGAVASMGTTAAASTAITATTAATNKTIATTAAGVAAGVAGGLASAWAPAAFFASTATLGGAAAIGTTALATGMAATLAIQFVGGLLSNAISAAQGGPPPNPAQGLPPGRRIGGNVYDGQDYIVGEDGPERIRMHGNGSVTPNSKLMRDMSGASAGNDIIINVQNYGGEKVDVIHRGFDPQQRREIVDIMVGELQPGNRAHKAVSNNFTTNTRTR